MGIVIVSIDTLLFLLSCSFIFSFLISLARAVSAESIKVVSGHPCLELKGDAFCMFPMRWDVCIYR